MGMSYKDDCERCIEYLCGQRAGLEGFEEGESYEHFKEWQKKPDEDKWESLVEYTKAVRAALEMISYYETCSAIIKAKEGPEYVENIGREYYKMMTAPIGERFGIGFGKGDDVIEDD